MAKKNWRDSGKLAPDASASKANKANWGASNQATKSPSMGSAGKIFFLLATAAMLGGLIALYRQFLIPEVKTPILFCDAYPSSEGERILSTNAGAIETQKRLAENTHADLDTKPANLRTISDVSINPRKKVAFFYLYADLFVGDDKQPYLLSHDRRADQTWDGNAVQSSANTELRKFLEDVCRLEIGDCPRIVVMDCGRLDAPAYSQIQPDASCQAVQTVLASLREAKVPNVDRLWVLMATDDYQLGWASPELGGSVFGYFFSAGLRGLADTNKDGSVSLAELSLFVQDSVARWVENYRDSVQTPRLLAGGDLQDAAAIHLVFPHSAEYETVTGFPVLQTAHDALWRRVFDLPQPHRRQMVTTRLVRLEQLRFCQSKEYPQLLQQVQTILHESDTTTVLKLPVSPDLWDDKFRDQHKVAFESDVMKDYAEFLTPSLPLADEAQSQSANATKLASETAGADSQPTAGSTETAADDSSKQKSNSPVEKPKTLGAAIENLSSPGRLAVVWHYLRSQPAGSHFSQTQMDESMNFILRGDSASPVCDEWIQMQFLDLLQRSLPWDKQDFDPALPVAAVQCFEASERLAQADLSPRRNVRAGEFDGGRNYAAWLNWRHVQPAFFALENRRRYALDAAIAGNSAEAISEFKSLLLEYDELRKQWSELIEARRVATNLLFVLPYLKSFVVRDTVYRQHQITGARSFALPLEELVELEQAALEMQALLSGRVMTVNDLKRLSVLKVTAAEISNELRGQCSRIVDEAKRVQSASEYAFAALGLLSTPIPEWIDQRSSSAATPTRSTINRRLEQQLQAQQQAFFRNPAAAELRTEAQLDSIRERQREIVVTKLQEFGDAFAQVKLASTADLNLGRSTSWNEVQRSLENLTPLETLKNDSPKGADFAFADATAIDQEILRLDAIDRQLRVADPLLGLTETPAELYQQQIRVHQFAAEHRLAVRALDDFWGNGNVKKVRERVPPVERQIRLHVRNMEEIAGESAAFRLAGKMYNAYDAGSLKQIATDFSKSERALWHDFSQLEVVWRFNDEVLPLTEQQLTFSESADSESKDGSPVARLAFNLERIGEVLNELPYRPSAGPAARPLTGVRISLDRQKYFEALEIPTSVRNARAIGEVVFRGHQFFQELAITKKIIKKLPPEAFVFQPKFSPNDTSMVTVENDVANEVNLVFLIDCSGSMKNGDMLKKVKEATRAIMLELVRERRFHIGLAVFAHRGEFTEDREDGRLVTVDGRFPIKGNHHPFDDWEMLVKPPDSISDEQFVSDLCDLQLDPLQPRGVTPLYYSIAKTLPLVNNTDRKNILIVVTDGKDSQYPDHFPNDARAEPKLVDGQRVRPTTINDLNQVYTRFAGKINVLVLETEQDIGNQMPTGFTSIALGNDTVADMKKHVLDFVGRYKFSVTPAGDTPTDKDLTKMGDTLFLKVSPDSEYLIQTHGVPTGQSQLPITLSGGEDLKFINTAAGLRLSSAQLAAARDGFLPPRITDSLSLGGESYAIGRRQSNQLNNVRIGFANRRGLSQFPQRVWARVRDAKGREFAMVTTTREFSEVPTYDFQMPNGFRETEIEMTLYVQPRGASAIDGDIPETTLAYREISGEDAGEFRGLKYEIVQNENSQTRFTATITGFDGPIQQDFQLEALHSVPFPESRLLHQRTITYEDVQRVKEVFEFEIPTGQSPTFRLFVQPISRWKELTAEVPAVGKSKSVIDPVFGDEVIVVEMGKLRVKN